MTASRARWLLAVLAVLVPAASTLPFAAWLLDHDVIVINENAWRDVTVYGDIAQGALPLQGPQTSIGGHHGYLGTWPFGLWMRLQHGLAGLQTVSVLLWLATAGVMTALARRGASWPAVLAALPVVLSTNLYLMPQFPNHIMLIPVSAALAVYGTMRAPEHAGWALLGVVGITLGIGAHRTGWATLALLVLFDLRGARALLRPRRVWVWLPLLAYLAVPAWLSTLDTPVVPGRTPAGGLLSEIGRMDPGLVLLTMPWFHFEFMVFPPLQVPQLLTVVGLWVLGRRALAARDDDRVAGLRLALDLYATWFVLLTFYKYDMHYYMPMLGLLPLVLASGLDAVWDRSTRRGLAAMGWMVVLHGVSAAGPQTMLRQFVDAPDSPLVSLTPKLAMVDALDALQVSEDEVYQATWYAGRTEIDRLAWLHRGTSTRVGTRRDPDAPRRCVRIVPADAPVPDGRLQTAPAGEAWRVDLVPPTGPQTPCAANLEAYGPAIWWYDARTGGLVHRVASQEVPGVRVAEQTPEASQGR